MKKDNLKVQKAYDNDTNAAISEIDHRSDSNCREKVSNDKNFFDKIGVRNPHPWSLIGLR